jgi:FlaG/FlaF family flagellin (archaellin)
MTTFKKLADRVRAFNRDEEGASNSIEQIGAIAVAVLVLAAVLKVVIDKILPAMETKMINLINNT